jgi:hypothetical protein
MDSDNNSSNEATSVTDEDKGYDTTIDRSFILPLDSIIFLAASQRFYQSHGLLLRSKCGESSDSVGFEHAIDADTERLQGKVVLQYTQKAG